MLAAQVVVVVVGEGLGIRDPMDVAAVPVQVQGAVVAHLAVELVPVGAGLDRIPVLAVAGEIEGW